METSKYGQTFWQAEADALFPAGCKCGNNGGGDCDWCRIYYNGPVYEGLEAQLAIIDAIGAAIDRDKS